MMTAAAKWLALVTLLATGAAQASPPWQPYTEASFRAARQAGHAVIVDIYAAWCSVCKLQGPILDELRNEPSLANATFFKVDFDEDKDFVRAYRIPRQSTVLVFRQNGEIARSIAETDRGRLREFVLGAATR